MLNLDMGLTKTTVDLIVTPGHIRDSCKKNLRYYPVTPISLGT